MPWTEIFRFFYILGFVNAFFFGFIIFSKKNRSQSDQILGVWLFILALQFLWPFLYLSNFEKYLLMAGYEVIFFSLHPIFLYNYIKSLTKSKLTTRNILISLLPVLIIILVFLPFLTMSYDERYRFIVEKSKIPLSLIPGFICIISNIIIFLFLGFRELKQHKNNTLHLYSYRDNVDLLWLRRLIIGYAGITLLSLPISALLYFNGYPLALSDYIFYAILVVFVFFLGYWGYQQGSIFNISQVKLHESPEKSNNSNVDYQSEASQLKNLMKNNKPYLDAGLSLHELSDLSGINPHHLSKVINKTFNMNFFEFINHYRTEEFKLLVKHPKYNSFTILGIALECGFNSKSSFNRIFKEQTGQTPGEYKSQIKS